MGTYNPLLHHCGELPPYSSVQAQHLVPAMLQVRNDASSTIEAILLSQRNKPTWDDFVVPLDELNARMSWFVGTLRVLSGARSGADWTRAFQRCARVEAQFERLFWSNGQLYDLYRKLAASPQARQFARSRQVLLDRVLQRFRLSGMDLSARQFQRFRALREMIDERRRQFLGNALQAAHCSSFHISVEQEAQLEGLSARDKASMARYQGSQLLGWRIDLSDPQLIVTIMTDVRSRALREQVYRLSNTLASDEGLQTCKGYDNEGPLEQLLALRLEQARMLGFGNSAELALQGLSVRETAHVLWFLSRQVAQQAPEWNRQRQELLASAPQPDVQALEPWDYLFEGQRLRTLSGALDEDEFRNHFELERVLAKMLDLSARLFGIELIERRELDTWHASIRAFEVREGGRTTGYLFLDLFSRDQKLFKSGFMFSLGHRLLSVEGRGLKVPMVVLSCALPTGAAGAPVLLKHGQLRTLFHEFGHCLHQLLDSSETWQLSCPEHSGLDVREFFSRLMERWCYNVEFLVDMGRHHQTGASLSGEQVRRLRIALQSQTWLQDSAQMMYASVDFLLHLLQPVDNRQIRLLIKESLAHWPRPAHERFIYAFKHLAAGYEARYFTYGWAQELAREVFARFEDKGLFNTVEGRRLRAELFTPAAIRPLVESIEAFLGQPPKAAMQASSDADFNALVEGLNEVQVGETVDEGAQARAAQAPLPRSAAMSIARMLGSVL